MLRLPLTSRLLYLKHLLSTFTALLLLLLLFPAPAGAQTSSSHPSASPHQPIATSSTYSNPIIAQTLPDPAIIKGLDGYYYVIATSDRWEDGSFHLLPTYRSTDLIHWQFVHDAFTTRPDWVDANAGLWAPDLQYFNRKYYLYYTASSTQALPKYNVPAGNSAIGVAVADSPVGPWQDMGDSAGGSFQHGPLVPPRPCVYNTDPKCYYWTIDPAAFTDHDGQHYLYYGSFYGGTVVQKLSTDGLHVTGSIYQIGHWDHYEGTYVIRHDVNGKAYYYNFSSAANCCNGPETAYSVEVSRATSPLGPFLDQNGFPMVTTTGQPVPTQRPSDDPAGDNVGAQGGGYPTLKPNGNKWRGVGHNAIITDLAGQDWILYHGIDANNGWVNGSNISFRQLLLDRIDWTADGWPIVNDGNGPSLTNVAPIMAPIFGDTFNMNTTNECSASGNGDDLKANWHMVGGTWQVNAGNCTTGGFVEQTTLNGQNLLLSQKAIPSGYRVAFDLRMEQTGSHGRYGGVVSYGLDRTFVAVLIDPAQRKLITIPYQHGQAIQGEQATALPADFDLSDWNHLTIDEDTSAPGHFRFMLSNGQRDPLAVQDRTLPASFHLSGGNIGFLTQNTRVAFDNIESALLTHHVAPAQTVPSPGVFLPAFSDEFNSSLDKQWSWVHEDTTRHSLANGQLSITVNGDLYRNSNSATNLLLETPPTGDYMLETKMLFDPDTNYQQAGLLVYSDDDHYIKVGVTHHESLNKIISGHETLDPAPGNQTACDVQPAAGSNIAITTYTTKACPLEGESWDYLSNPHSTQNGSTAAHPAVVDWLRIYRHGNVYTPYNSLDGIHWVRGTAWDLTAASSAFPVKIGLFAFSSGPANTISANFDFVHVYRQL